MFRLLCLQRRTSFNPQPSPWLGGSLWPPCPLSPLREAWESSLPGPLGGPQQEFSQDFAEGMLQASLSSRWVRGPALLRGPLLALWWGINPRHSHGVMPKGAGRENGRRTPLKPGLPGPSVCPSRKWGEEMGGRCGVPSPPHTPASDSTGSLRAQGTSEG